MDHFNKRITLYILLTLFIAIIILICSLTILNSSPHKWDNKEGEMRDEIEMVFENYKSSDNIAMVTRNIKYKEYDIDLFGKVYNYKQIIVKTDNYYYVNYNEDWHGNKILSFFKGDFKNDTVVVLFKKSMPSEPDYEVNDNKFYISYKEDRKFIVDVYDIVEEKYYNYLTSNNKIDLEQIIKKDIIEKYRYDVEVLDEEKAFLIKNIDSNEVIIVNDNFIKKTAYNNEMSLFEYKPYQIYISNGHILLIYYIGIEKNYLSAVVFEYLHEGDIRFLMFTRYFYFDSFKDVKYVYVK